MLVISLLGPPSATRDGEPCSVRGEKAWLLLARFLRADQPLARARLAAEHFPDAKDPAGALRWNLSQLRRSLGIDLDGDPVVPGLPADAVVDVHLLTGADVERAAALPGLDDGLLGGVEPTDAPAVALWLDAERRHVARLVADVRREAVLRHLGRDDVAAALVVAEALSVSAPLDEDAAALLVRCLHLAGRPDDARAVAEEAAHRIRSATGADVGPRLRRALGATPGGSRHATGPVAVVAQVEAGTAALAAGAVDTGLEALRSALVAARALGNRRLLARALLALGRALIESVRSTDDDGPALLHEAIPLAESIGDGDLVAAAARQLGYVDLLRGRYARSFVWLDRARGLTEDLDTRGWIDVYEAVGRDDLGQQDHAATLLDAADEAAASAGDARLATYATTIRGRQHLTRDRLDEAVVTLRDGVRRARRCEWTGHVPFPESLLADALRRTGDLSTAAGHAEHAVVLAEQVGDPCYRACGLRSLGLVRVDQARVEEGLTILTDVPAFCASVPDAYRWMHAYALDATADATSGQALPDAADWVEASMSLAAALGLQPLLERSRTYRQRLDRTEGRPAG